MEILKILALALLEGITEWLPVSSTGHLLLFDQLLRLEGSADFKSVFFVLVQLGAVLAVCLRYFKVLWPIKRKAHQRTLTLDRRICRRWGLIVWASLPAAVVGVLLDDWFEATFYRPGVIALMLALIALLFLWVERASAPPPCLDAVDDLSFRQAFWIGCWQLLAAALPGTSRSGATIAGAMLLGISRPVATTFTFWLAIPAMMGASLLKLLRHGLHFSLVEWMALGLGALVAFVVSQLTLTFLIRYVKTHSLRPFAYYRMGLALVIVLWIWLG